MITIEQFENLIGTKSFLKDGKPCFNHTINLNERKDITELPDNITVLGGLDLSGSGVKRLSKGLTVMWWLNISQTDIEELPEDTKFYGNLYVEGMNKPFSFPKVVDVKSNFYCRATTVKRMPEELYTKISCDFSGSTFDNYPKIMKVGCSLYFYDTRITELPKGLTEIYGNFDIRRTKVSKLNDNLVVYKNLDLGHTQIEELPKGLIANMTLDLYKVDLKDYSNLHKVCREFALSKNKYAEIKDSLAEHRSENLWGKVYVIFKPNHKGAYLFENEIGKYIKADGIFGKIVKQKGNVYHVNMYEDGNDVITYLVTDGEGHWAHGTTFNEAKEDLFYKINKRNTDEYKELSLDSVLSFDEAIVCYRVITGACSFGTKYFITNVLGENKKDKYTIREIIELTEGEFGNEDFKKFFSK